MRPHELDIVAANRRHAREVGRAHQETRKRRGKRDGAARGEPHRRAHHHLFGNEAFVEAIGKRTFELVAERRVLHVCVEHDDARVRFTQLDERGAERLARGDLLTQRVRGWRHGRRRHDRARR